MSERDARFPSFMTCVLSLDLELERELLLRLVDLLDLAGDSAGSRSRRSALPPESCPRPIEPDEPVDPVPIEPDEPEASDGPGAPTTRTSPTSRGADARRSPLELLDPRWTAPPQAAR